MAVRNDAARRGEDLRALLLELSTVPVHLVEQQERLGGPCAYHAEQAARAAALLSGKPVVVQAATLASAVWRATGDRAERQRITNFGGDFVVDQRGQYTPARSGRSAGDRSSA